MCIIIYIYISSLFKYPWSLLISNMDYLPRLWFQQCFLSAWLWFSLPLTPCPPYFPGSGGHNSFSKKTQDGQWPQSAMKEERQVTIGHQSCRVFATYSLPGVLANLPTMAMCIRLSRSRLCPSTLFLSASSTSPGPRFPHYPCLLHSCSFRNNTHTPPTYPLASLRLPLLLSSLSPRLRPREPPSLAVCWLCGWVAPAPQWGTAYQTSRDTP